MDGNTIVKTLETVNNLSKLAANVSEKKPEKTEKKTYKEGNSTSQPHNQTVEVKVGATESTPKVKEKHETHIHKPFPENRELSERECEIEKLRLTQEHEREMARIKFEIESAEYERKRQEYYEEKARKEAEEQKAEDRKWRRRLLIGAGIGGAIGLGLMGYDAWRVSKLDKTHAYQRLPQPPVSSPAPINPASDIVEAEVRVE